MFWLLLDIWNDTGEPPGIAVSGLFLFDLLLHSVDVIKNETKSPLQCRRSSKGRASSRVNEPINKLRTLDT